MSTQPESSPTPVTKTRDEDRFDSQNVYLKTFALDDVTVTNEYSGSGAQVRYFYNHDKITGYWKPYREPFIRDCVHFKQHLETQQPFVRRYYELRSVGGFLQQGTYSQGLRGIEYVLGPLIGETNRPRLDPLSQSELNSFSHPLGDGEISDIALEALRNMKPDIGMFTGGFSALNFLFELKDVKSMFRFWSTNEAFLRNAAGGFLNVEFGWKPFLRDMKTITKRVFSLMDQVRAWNTLARNKTVITRHYNASTWLSDHRPELLQTLSQDLLRVDYADQWLRPGGGANMRQTHWFESTTKDNVKVIFTMAFIPQEVDVSSASAILGIYSDGLGLGNGPVILWDALPFSFIVDWFWGVGRFLEQFENPSTDIGYDLCDACYSVKRNYTHTMTPHISDGVRGYSIFSDLGKVDRVVETYVRRQCRLPVERLTDIDWSGLLSLSIPGWKQFLLGGAIAIRLAI